MLSLHVYLYYTSPFTNLAVAVVFTCDKQEMELTTPPESPDREHIRMPLSETDDNVSNKVQALLSWLLKWILRTNRKCNRSRSPSPQQTIRMTPPTYEQSTSPDVLARATTLIHSLEEDAEDIYLMSGALHPDDRRLHYTSYHESTVCFDEGLLETAEIMPFKLMDKTSLQASEFFPDSIFDFIPDDAMTTYEGFRRMVDELDQTGGWRDDYAVLIAMFRRLGRVPDERRVVYPEDLMPCIHVDDREFDTAYWDAVLQHAED